MMTFSIKELENFSGIKAHTIRTWEQRFTFLRPGRSAKLRRTYTLEELKLILDVSLLNRNGYRVSQIARMNRHELIEALRSLQNLHQKQEKAINELVVCMANLDAECFEMVLQGCVIAWGIDETINKTLVPFAKKAGLLNGSPKEYKPHLLIIEQSVKHKIIAGIEKIPAPKSGETALFFLSKKSSELELLYLQYQLKMAGFRILYITAAASTTHLTTIANVTKPLYIITSLSEKQHAFNKEEFLSYVDDELPQTIFLNVGNSSFTSRTTNGIKQLPNIEQAWQFVREREGALV